MSSVDTDATRIPTSTWCDVAGGYFRSFSNMLTLVLLVLAILFLLSICIEIDAYLAAAVGNVPDTNVSTQQQTPAATTTLSPAATTPATPVTTSTGLSDNDLRPQLSRQDAIYLPLSCAKRFLKFLHKKRSSLSQRELKGIESAQKISMEINTDAEKNLAWHRQLQIDLNFQKKLAKCIRTELLRDRKLNKWQRYGLKSVAERKAKIIMKDLSAAGTELWKSTMQENERRRKMNLSAVNDKYIPATGVIASLFWVPPPAWILQSCLLNNVYS